MFRSPPLCTCFAVTKNRVNDLSDRCGGVDRNAVLWNGFRRLMRPFDDFSFLLLSAPVGGVNENALIYAPKNRVNVVAFKNENTV